MKSKEQKQTKIGTELIQPIYQVYKNDDDEIVLGCHHPDISNIIKPNLEIDVLNEYIWITKLNNVPMLLEVLLNKCSNKILKAIHQKLKWSYNQKEIEKEYKIFKENLDESK